MKVVVLCVSLGKRCKNVYACNIASKCSCEKLFFCIDSAASRTLSVCACVMRDNISR